MSPWLKNRSSRKLGQSKAASRHWGNMARYRKVDVRIWIDDKFRSLSAMPPSGQGLWLFLLTNERTTPIPGLYSYGAASMCETLGWKPKDFKSSFSEIEALGLVKVDWKNRVIWIPNAFRYNRPESPNVVKSWPKIFDEVPDCVLKYQALSELKQWLSTMPESFRIAFDKAFQEHFVKPMPNHEQEHEQEHETTLSRSRTNATVALVENSLAIAEVLACYKRHHPKAKPGMKEKALVKARLGEGFAHGDLIKAIDSIHAQPFYCGQNDRRTRYQKLIHALRNSDTVTSHLEWYDKNYASHTHQDSIWDIRGASWGLGPEECAKIALEANYDRDKFDELARGLFNG